MVRMMGLSSHRAALLAGFAVRNPPVAPRVLLLPTKPAALRGPLFWVGSSPHHIKKQGISFVMPCFLVRMMGLSSHRAALSPCSAARKSLSLRGCSSSPQSLRLCGVPFFGGFKSSSYKETRHHSVVPCFLVRMMGLEPTGYCYH